MNAITKRGSISRCLDRGRDGSFRLEHGIPVCGVGPDPEQFNPHCPISVHQRVSPFLSAVKILALIRPPAFGSAKVFPRIRKAIHADGRGCFRTMLRPGEMPTEQE